MNSHQKIWQTWVDILQRWGVDSLVTSILESTGPLHLLGAQAVYIGQPLFAHLVPSEHLEALADVLEDPEKMHAFTALLENRGLSTEFPTNGGKSP